MEITELFQHQKLKIIYLRYKNVHQMDVESHYQMVQNHIRIHLIFHYLLLY